MNLKPYPEYKESGVAWLGEIPGHWGIVSVKRYYEIQLGKMLQNFPKSESDTKVPYLKAQHVQWFHVHTHNLPIMYAAVSEINQYSVREGDLLVCEGGEGGRCAIISRLNGNAIIQNALHRVRPVSDCRNDFLQYVMNTISSLGWFSAINSKATIAHFTREKFGMLKVPIPPPEEQLKIALFLDRKIAQINKFIRNKRKLVALLKEQKQAIINQAVTRGINPDVRLKPSGVEWIGDIPEHWEVRRIKHLVHSIDQGVSPQAEALLADKHSWGVLKSGCVNHGIFRETEHKRLPENFKFDPELIVKVGDVLVSRGSGSPHLVGSVGQVESVQYKLILSDKTFRLNFKKTNLIPFWVRFLNSRHYRLQVEQVINGAEGLARNIPLTALRNIKLPVPPANEGKQIANTLDIQLKTTDLAISRAEREIELMGEYRTRLISDVVTGKVDVRNIPVEAVQEEELLQEMETEEPDEMEEESIEEEEAV